MSIRATISCTWAEAKRYVQRVAEALLLGLCLVFSASAYSQEVTKVKPNVILILADDLGYGDLGGYGGESKTPHLDKLAREGLKFTDFHSNGAVCSPTRAALLTGRYQQRMGVEKALGEGEMGLGNSQAQNEVTIAGRLREAGYNTGIIGKWHLGYAVEQSPIHFGFDEFRGMLHGAVDYHSHINTYGRFDWWHNARPIKESGYVTSLITDHSLQFLDNHQSEPFFLFVSHLAIHFPWQGPDDNAMREEGEHYNAVDGPKNKLGPHPPEKAGAVVRTMIEEMDKSVGRIIAKVHDLGLDKRTLVFFTSDNGGITKYRGGYTEVSSNYPLRGAKGQLYEGGHRVPAIAWWPGVIGEGRITGQTVMSMDLLPTILEVAGLERPKDGERNVTDGVSFFSLLLREESMAPRTLFWRHGRSLAARSGDWKLVLPDSDKSPELYNLSEDVSEKFDLAAKHPGVVNELMSAMKAWQRDVSEVAQRSQNAQTMPNGDSEK